MQVPSGDISPTQAATQASTIMAFQVERTKIPKFNGDDSKWRTWKADMKGVFFALEVADIVSKTRKRPEADELNQAAWDKDNSKIYYHILWLTEGTPKDIVILAGEESEDGMAVWAALHEKYERSGTARLAALQCELLDSRLSPDADPDTVFNHMECLQRQVRDMGVIVDNSTMQAVLLRHMPASLEMLQSHLDHISGLDWKKFKEHPLRSETLECWWRRRQDRLRATGQGQAQAHTFSGQMPLLRQEGSQVP